MRQKATETPQPEELREKNELLQWALTRVREGVPCAAPDAAAAAVPDKASAAANDTAARRTAVPGSRAPASGGIGTLGERTLHAALKYCYEPDDRFHETPAAGFVADILRADGAIEIQTGGFYPLAKKLPALLQLGPVKVVHPLAAQKRIVWVEPETGEISAPRKSPRPDRASDVLAELFWLRDLLEQPGLQFELPLLAIDEYKLRNGFGEQRKTRATRCERIPAGWLGCIRLGCPRDYAALLPEALPAVFTAAEFSKALCLRGRRASAALRVLQTVGAVRRTGEVRGRAYLYEKLFE